MVFLVVATGIFCLENVTMSVQILQDTCKVLILKIIISVY